MAIDTDVPLMGGHWISQSAADRLGVLSRREMDELRRSGSSRHADAGTVVAPAGAKPRHIQIICNGELDLMTRLPSGRVTMAVVRGGGVIADIPMLLGTAMPFDAVASRDTELILLTRDRWMELLSSRPAICLRWMTSIARRLDDDRRRLVVVTTRPLIAQVAYLLLDLAEPGPDNRPVVRLSHTTLAHLIGARRQSVTRALGELREKGLVTTGYGVTEIDDEDGLRGVMGDDPLP
jgi:CRP-like cAMP-binding protein